VSVPWAPLETLLAKHGIGKVDLLSIDVEGSELAVWRSLDWEKHQLTVVIVEWNTLGSPPAKEALLEAFRPFPYDLLAETAGNLVFALRS